VAGRAIGHQAFFHKLTAVIIGVAIGATDVVQRIGQAGLVTGFAIDRLVPAFQLKRCLVVIEFIHPLHKPEGFFVMALPAILPELSFVNIRMAAGAFRIGDTRVWSVLFAIPDLGFMAFDAFDIPVFSRQGELRTVVIKLIRRFEFGEIMAL
jgi:hypothetical protein